MSPKPPLGPDPPGTVETAAPEPPLPERGRDLLVRLRLHVLLTLRATPRCLPWRSGRTLQDLSRRAGLAWRPPPGRSPILHDVLEALLAEKRIVRTAAHYRLADGPPQCCPACRHEQFQSRPAGLPEADDPRARVVDYHCAACGCWSGLACRAVPADRE